jgi:hypothetical protein
LPIVSLFSAFTIFCASGREFVFSSTTLPAGYLIRAHSLTEWPSATNSTRTFAHNL